MTPTTNQGLDPSRRSLLTGPQRAWLTVALALTAVTVANTLYLMVNRVADGIRGPVGAFFAEGDYDVPRLFQVMVLSHTGLGAVVVVLLIVFGAWHLPRVWRRHRRRTVVSGVAFVVTGLALGATGPFIVYAAASREHAWVWWTHVIAAGAAPVLYVVHRVVSVVRPRGGSYARFGAVTAILVVAMIVGHGLDRRATGLRRDRMTGVRGARAVGPGSGDRRVADYTDASYVPASFVPPESPFFPSAATTATGGYLPRRIITRGDESARDRLDADLDTYGFAVNERIGADTCARCHPDTVEQWAASAHRFASFNNPFYEATVNGLRERADAVTKGVAAHISAFPQWADRVGSIKSKWCGGCHDPAIMLAGTMTDPIDRRAPQAQAGLTCLACHAIDKIHNQTGNGNYNIADAQEDPYLFPDAAAGTLRAMLHDAAVKAKPETHKRRMLKPFFRTGAFCAACHKVSLQEPVNDYRWLRGQDEYDNWHDSGVAHNASRTFYLPPEKRVCQDCHMPYEAAPLGDVSARDGRVRSHRFLAVNTALPFVRGDHDTIERIERFLRDRKLRIDVFALTRYRGDRRETVYALDHTQPAVTPGETVEIDVVVRNLGVGHTFPGGTNDSNEGWIEFTMLDDAGNVVAQSGFVRDDGYVDPAAHFFRAVLVDRDGHAIHQRNAQDIYTAVYTSVIGPGTAQTVHYRVTVPPMPGRGIQLRARLLWRKFDRAYTEFAHGANPAGFARFEQCPDLPVTEICAADVRLRVEASAGGVQVSARPAGVAGGTDGAGSARRGGAERADRVGAASVARPVPPGRAMTPFTWIRYNDYGIGLLLQGDTRGAERAFREVVRLAPDRVDGYRNLVRIAIRDGDLSAAYDHLRQCEALASNDPQTAWFWGVVLQEDGQYVAAAGAYRRVLERFPEDRAAWRNLGRTYYLDGAFQAALDALDEVLRIDPEDRSAHYHRMLALRALGRHAAADAAEQAYVLYKVDESAQQVTEAYRLAHPFDNRESHAVHVHDLTGDAANAGTISASARDDELRAAVPGHAAPRDPLAASEHD
ncbi:MAG: tetratricopeptide repeat protein [Phycisphaerae bacterium]